MFDQIFPVIAHCFRCLLLTLLPLNMLDPPLAGISRAMHRGMVVSLVEPRWQLRKAVLESQLRRENGEVSDLPRGVGRD